MCRSVRHGFGRHAGYWAHILVHRWRLQGCGGGKELSTLRSPEGAAIAQVSEEDMAPKAMTRETGCLFTDSRSSDTVGASSSSDRAVRVQGLEQTGPDLTAIGASFYVRRPGEEIL